MTRPKDAFQRVSKVNTAPRGLQSLLGNVNQGINPHELAHQLSPGIDLYPFLVIDKKRWGGGLAAYTAVGDLIGVTVPEGEVWAVDNFSGIIPGYGTAGDTIRFAIVYADASGNHHYLDQSPLWTRSATADLYSLGHHFDSPLMLPPGWGLFVLIQEMTTAVTVYASYRYTYAKLTA